MLDMVIRERRHGVVTMVVIRLVADIDALDASLLGGLLEVLREKLALLVEVVAGTLRIRSISLRSQIRRQICGETRTTSIRTSSRPFHFFTSSVASCSAHFAFWSSPK